MKSRYFNLFLFTSLVFFCYSSPQLFAYEKGGVTIEAETLSYDEIKEIIEAQGKVKLTYSQVQIEAEKIYYEPLKGYLKADSKFKLFQADQTIYGEGLEWYLKENRGVAHDIKVLLGGVQVKGRSVEIKPQEFSLTDASFTTCDQEPPHFRISSERINLYPETGFVISSWGRFYLWEVPVLFLPGYIYIIEELADEKHKNRIPFPSVSYNDDEGLKISERFTYVRDARSSYGSFGLDYYSKGGFGFGIDHEERLDQRNKEFYHILFSPLDGWSLGLIHQSQITDQDLLEVEVASRNRINYEYVTYFPQLRLRHNFLGETWGIKSTLDLKAGWTGEESSSLWSSIFGASLNFNYERDLNRYHQFYSFLNLSEDTYLISLPFKRVIGEAGIRTKWHKSFDTRFGYEHYFIREGESPFAYERYRFSDHDKILADATYRFLGNTLKIESIYDIRDEVFEDLDYLISRDFHCMEFSVGYRSMRQEFIFGINLVRLM